MGGNIIELAEIFESEPGNGFHVVLTSSLSILYVVWVLGFRHVQRGTLEGAYLKSGFFRKVDLELEVFLGDFS